MENVKKFYDALANDKGMRDRAAALNEKYKGEKQCDNTVKTELLAFAKAEGYDFTVDELDAYSKQAQPVTDETAEMAADGAYDSNTCFCAVGGGGKESETGKSCACVAYGEGAVDSNNRYLHCVLAGWVKGVL